MYVYHFGTQTCLTTHLSTPLFTNQSPLVVRLYRFVPPEAQRHCTYWHFAQYVDDTAKSGSWTLDAIVVWHVCILRLYTSTPPIRAVGRMMMTTRMTTMMTITATSPTMTPPHVARRQACFKHIYSVIAAATRRMLVLLSWPTRWTALVSWSTHWTCVTHMYVVLDRRHCHGPLVGHALSWRWHNHNALL